MLCLVVAVVDELPTRGFGKRVSHQLFPINRRVPNVPTGHSWHAAVGDGHRTRNNVLIPETRTPRSPAAVSATLSCVWLNVPIKDPKKPPMPAPPALQLPLLLPLLLPLPAPVGLGATIDAAASACDRNSKWHGPVVSFSTQCLTTVTRRCVCPFHLSLRWFDFLFAHQLFYLCRCPRKEACPVLFHT